MGFLLIKNIKGTSRMEEWLEQNIYWVLESSFACFSILGKIPLP
jgi:hypothetical protein